MVVVLCVGLCCCVFVVCLCCWNVWCGLCVRGLARVMARGGVGEFCSRCVSRRLPGFLSGRVASRLTVIRYVRFGFVVSACVCYGFCV